MRAHALVLLVLLALLPTAAAQVPTSAPSATALRIVPFEDAVPRDGTATTAGVVEYSYFMAGATALAPTRVDLKIVDAPAWAVVTVSPETVYMPVSAAAVPGTSVEAPPQEFRIVVSLREDAPPGAAEKIRIEAVAHTNPPIGASSATESLLVATPAGATCDEPHADGVVIVEEDAADEDLTTATAATTPAALSPVPAVLGLAGAGAGAGVAWARRRRA